MRNLELMQPDNFSTLTFKDEDNNIVEIKVQSIYNIKESEKRDD